jgi:hypothetical protein
LIWLEVRVDVALKSGQARREPQNATAFANVHGFRRQTERFYPLAAVPARADRDVTRRDMMAAADPTPRKQKALTQEGFHFNFDSRTAYAKFFEANSQFTMFQYASTNFGRALR